jgi:hypothetical protein
MSFLHTQSKNYRKKANDQIKNSIRELNLASSPLEKTRCATLCPEVYSDLYSQTCMSEFFGISLKSVVILEKVKKIIYYSMQFDTAVKWKIDNRNFDNTAKF